MQTSIYILGVIACWINVVKACNYQKVAGSLEQFQYVLYEEILIQWSTNCYSRILNIHYVVVKVKQKALFWTFAPNIMQVVYWESFLKGRISGLMSVWIACIFNVVEMCSYNCICFHIGFTRSKNSYTAILCSIQM